MSNTLASILVNIDLSSGSTAINYTPAMDVCPVLGFNCVGSSGSGNIKLTPYNATVCTVGATSNGTGARLRIITGGAGDITSVEIAAGGTGYPTGAVAVTITDPFGTGGVISCTGATGAITGATIISAGTNYSGYILYDVNDFIEGVTYNIVPRYIEQTSGTGVLKLVGNKLPFRPMQIF